jgi:HD-GYP domain-containing protein (c-di-GMP phosphodiesterase class II)
VKDVIVRNVRSIFEFDPSEFDLELEALVKVRRHDEYTYLHSLNVARLSVNLGRKLEISGTRLIDLGWAALLHDLGKLHVPIEILNKVSKFAPQELAIMQSHPAEGLVAFVQTQSVNFKNLERLSAAFEHHQRYDLKGYPQVNRKIGLHPFSRIVAICDTFDAMTTDRIYQRRILPDLALKIMAQGYGTIFDPVVLQSFITGMGAFPVGSLVRLTDQSLAIVMDYNERSLLDRPIVQRLPLKDHKEIDLSLPEFSDLRILRSEFPEDHGVEIKN